MMAQMTEEGETKSMVVCVSDGGMIPAGEPIFCCLVCQNSFCDCCFPAHVKREHHFAATLATGDKVEFCEKHFREIDSFCEWCRLYICERCTEHKYHSVVSINARAGEFIPQIVSLKQQLEAAEKVLDGQWDLIYTRNENVQNRVRKDFSQILRCIGEVRTQINALENKILGIIEGSGENPSAKEMAVKVISLNGEVGAAIGDCEKFLATQQIAMLQKFGQVFNKAQQILDQFNQFSTADMDFKYNLPVLTAEEVESIFACLISKFDDVMKVKLELQSTINAAAEVEPETDDHVAVKSYIEPGSSTDVQKSVFDYVDYEGYHITSDHLLYICDTSGWTIFCYSLNTGDLVRKANVAFTPARIAKHEASLFFTGSKDLCTYRLYCLPESLTGQPFLIPIQSTSLDRGLTLCEDQLFVCDRCSKQIHIYDVGDWTNVKFFARPHCLSSVDNCSSSPKYLVLGCWSESRICIYGMKDRRLKFILSQCEGLHCPQGLALKGDYLFVCLERKKCIVKFKLIGGKSHYEPVIQNLPNAPLSLSFCFDGRLGILLENKFTLELGST